MTTDTEYFFREIILVDEEHRRERAAAYLTIAFGRMFPGIQESATYVCMDLSDLLGGSGTQGKDQVSVAHVSLPGAPVLSHSAIW